MPRPITAFEEGFSSTTRPLGELADVDGILYFAGWDRNHGDELWRSDGTTSGTYRVTDQVPGPASFSPSGLTGAGGLLFFTAFDPVAGWQLWRSDGTAAGTLRLSDLPAGSFALRPGNLKEAGNRLFFFVPQDTGRQSGDLWTSDGTAEGTHPVLFSETGSSIHAWSLYSVCDFAGKYHFVDQRGVLRATDGTPEGSNRVWPASGDGDIQITDFQVSGDRLYFLDLSSGEPWQSDGTAAGTHVASWWDERFDGLYSDGFGVSGSTILISLWDDNTWDEPELWVGDDRGGIFEPAKNIRGTNSFGFFPELARCGKGFAFSGYSPKHGVEPCFSTGSAKRTRLLQNLNRAEWDSGPYSFVSTGKLAYFIAEGTRTGEEVWVTSGTGARPVADVWRGKQGSAPRNLTVSAGKVFWIAEDKTSGAQLWCSNGSPAGTRKLTALPARGLAIGGGETLGRDGVFYFSAYDPEEGFGLWSSDGSVEGTWRVTPADGIAAPQFSIGSFRNGGDRIFFRSSTWPDPPDLWMSDGAPEGTRIAVGGRWDVAGLPRHGDVLGELGGKVFILENSSGWLPRTLWRYDGGGVLPVPVAAGGVAPGNPGEHLFFTHDSQEVGNEPWVTDGTLEGTHVLKDVRPPTPYGADPAPDSNPVWLGTAAGKTYFSAELNFLGRELMVTDGTIEGTAMVKDLQTGPGWTTYGTAHAWNGQLYFLAANELYGSGLWRTDGTGAGTVQIKRTGWPSETRGLWNPGAFAELGGKLYFIGTADGNETQLWVTDGTTEGTQRVRDVHPGNGGDSMGGLVATAGHLYFSADDGRHGSELWRSDGTTEGTVLVEDLVPGWESSYPHGLVSAGGKLFFLAWTRDSGLEPYVIDSP